MPIKPIVRWLPLMLFFGLGSVLFTPGFLSAQLGSLSSQEEFSRLSISGSGFYQFPAGLDSGGNFRLMRFSINGRWSHRVNSNLGLGVGLRYVYDDYSFSDTAGFSGRAPWGGIHMPDLSLAGFYRTDSDWRFLVAATAGLSGESGADTSDALIYGGILSASKKIDPNLTLGLGAGIYRRFEETSVFPIIFIKWKLSEQWSVGNALQAGPTGPAGLELVYRPWEDWGFGLGGAYRSLRFRLDRSGNVPGGIGSDKSIPVWLRASKRLSTQVTLDLYGGLLLAGELRLEDRSGHELAADNYQTTPFLALNFSWKL
jgi:Domain of unknown function (DUF6268)